MISEATIRLVRPPAARGLLVLAFARRDRRGGGGHRPAPGAAVHHREPHPGAAHGPARSRTPPARWCLALVEAGGEARGDLQDHAARLAATIGRRPGAADTALVEDAAAQAALWRVREDGAGRAARLPDGSPAWPGFEDGVVPPERLAAYLGELRALLRDL